MAHRTVNGDIVVTMALHAPTHSQRLRHLFDHRHLLHLPMTLLTLEIPSAGRHMSHVRELDVVRHFVDTNPGNRLTAVPIIPELLDLLWVVSALDHGVAAHARGFRRNPRIHGALRREMAVLTVDLELTRMRIVRKRNGLDRRYRFGRRRRSPLLRRLYEGQGAEGRNSSHGRE